jgi:hypothetical protein
LSDFGQRATIGTTLRRISDAKTVFVSTAGMYTVADGKARPDGLLITKDKVIAELRKTRDDGSPLTTGGVFVVEKEG